MRDPEGLKLNNLTELKTFRKELRNQLTPAEAKLWDYLKAKKLEGRKFRRQHSVGPFILDFYCPDERLAVELDGQAHASISAQDYDHERDMFLAHFGILVLRFENQLVFKCPESVLNHIKKNFRWRENQLLRRDGHPCKTTTPAFGHPSFERRGVKR